MVCVLENSRLIAVLPWSRGRVVKSYGYSSFRPGVLLETALDTLDRWQLDEIIIIDISKNIQNVNPELVNSIQRSSISTPISVGGGIREISDVRQLLEVGCDRFVVEELLFQKSTQLTEIKNFVGRQALIGSLPIIHNSNGKGEIWGPLGSENRNILSPIDYVNEWFANDLISEVFITDVLAEGSKGSFSLIELFSSSNIELPKSSVIWFGGIDEEIGRELLDLPETAAVSFGNHLFEKELTGPHLRNDLNSITKHLRQTRLN